MKIAAVIMSLCLMNTLYAHALTIHGSVSDEDTKEFLVGAAISISGEGIKTGTVTDMEGNYHFSNLHPGTYTITSSYTGYKSITKQITLTTADIVQNFALDKSSHTLNEVSISSKMAKSTDAAARLSEKNANQILNIISAQSIRLLPDISVANVLQRVSGVSIEKNNSGDGQYAIIRGMDKRYNYTLINGIKIPSPDSKNRYVPLDIFPSDILGRLEVIKALTPDMEPDAIGGAMNLVMKDAPNERLVDISAATGFNDLLTTNDFLRYNRGDIQKNSPQERFGTSYLATSKDFPKSNLDGRKMSLPINQLYNLTLGNRFGKQKNLGILFALTYQNTYRSTSSNVLKAGGQPNQDPAPGNNATFSDFYIRQYSTNQQRVGGYLKFDYSFNSRHKISLNNMLMKMSSFQFRTTLDSVLNINSTGPGNRLVQNMVRSISQYQTIFNTTLTGTDKFSDKLNLNWALAYSIATNNTPDWAEYVTAYQVTTDTAGNVTKTANNEQTMTRRWQHNSDQDLSGYANLHYQLGTIDLSAGGMYRRKTRDNYYIEYDLKPDSTITFTDINHSSFTFLNAGEGQGLYPNSNTYTAHENVSAGYLMAKFMLTKQLQVLGGMRVEQTYFDYKTVLPDTYTNATGHIQYTDLLPGLHLKYNLQHNQDVRLSYFRSISRPAFNEITPYSLPGEYYDERGNIALKHSTADNIDLRYEWFPKKNDQVLFGIFYKNITNPIENALVPSGAISFIQPNNFGTAINYGAEVVLIKYIKSFGINFNYTYTHSSITTTKEYYGRASYPSGAIKPTYLNQTRPLQNQSAHIGNLSLLYKGKRSGLDAQVALVYTGPRIVFVSPFYQLDFWQKGNVQTDISLEKRIYHHFAIYTKVNNLFNVAYKVELRRPYEKDNVITKFQPDPNSTLIEKSLYGRNYLLGIRYHLN